MDPLKVLRLYLALNAHYKTKNYDIFEAKAAVKNCNISTLNSNAARKSLIDRLSRRFKTPAEVMGYLFPQWLYSAGTTLYDYSLAEENYNKWQKFRMNPNYYIHRDLGGWEAQELIMGNEPRILKEVSKGSIAIESAVALQKIKPYIDPNRDYFVFNTLCNTIVKSINFIKFDEDILRVEYETA